MALKNLFGTEQAISACGSACGSSDKPAPSACGTEEKPAPSACGAEEKPTPSACGSACGAADKE